MTPKEIEEYYRDVYVPRFRQRAPQQIVPTLDKVRAHIQQTLTESKIESSLQKYLDDARERAEIVKALPLASSAWENRMDHGHIQNHTRFKARQCWPWFAVGLVIIS